MEQTKLQKITRNSRGESERVLIVLDSTKENENFRALDWAFTHLVRSNDTALVLAVVNDSEDQNASCLPFPWPFRHERLEFTVPAEEVDPTLLQDKITAKKESCIDTLRPFHEKCKRKGAKLEFMIAAGFSPKQITIREANRARATWIVLDSNLKKDRKYILDHVAACHIAVVNRNNVARVLTRENQFSSSSISATDSNNVDSGDISVSMSQDSEADIQYPLSKSWEKLDTLQDKLQLERSKSKCHRIIAPQVPCSMCVDGVVEGLEKRFKTVELGSPSITEDQYPQCYVCQNKRLSGFGPLRQFSIEEIREITNDFSPISYIAEHGSGQLYKGIIKHGSSHLPLLVKKFWTSSEREFWSEIEILSVAHHRNLLTLRGFCNDISSPILVYEFACNGQLDQHLSSEKILEWPERRKIAIGVAQGLRYLNEECRDGTVLHRYIQPSNILLTHNYSPLISNFGCARRLRHDEESAECRVCGTAGYVAPECSERGILSVKADAYSFGILLLELISGRKALDVSRITEERSLVDWARPLLERRALHELCDPRLGDSYDMYELYCMVSAASVCIRKDHRSRASMSQVVSILRGDRDMIIPSPISEGRIDRTLGDNPVKSIPCSPLT